MVTCTCRVVGGKYERRRALACTRYKGHGLYELNAETLLLAVRADCSRVVAVFPISHSRWEPHLLGKWKLPYFDMTCDVGSKTGNTGI